VAKLLLKARPVLPQLVDRLRRPLPDGLELYLDTRDIASDAALDAAQTALEAAGLPTGFALLIEGPVRSLDGTFFETSRNAEVDRKMVRRLVRLGARIGARAINLHLIYPSASPEDLTLGRREALLEQCLPFTRYFVDEARQVGIVPTLENMPPVLRMQQGGHFYSPIGMPAEDLIWMTERIEGLRVCLDLSHAGLYLNARRLSERPDPPSRYRRVLEFVSQLPPVHDVQDYADRLGARLFSCQLSNAAGMLGEGRSYTKGDLDLDALVKRLADRVAYFVTETAERDPGRATMMREALRRMRSALQSLPIAVGTY
jgi:sugar phosphate isomerase/epimerase